MVNAALTAGLSFDLDLIREYDHFGSRYTSYPTDFDPELQNAVNRVQSEAETRVVLDTRERLPLNQHCSNLRCAATNGARLLSATRSIVVSWWQRSDPHTFSSTCQRAPNMRRPIC
jgi:hypothetical protein